MDKNPNLLYVIDMVELMRSTDHATLAFAKALLSGEGIPVFELDVNMSVLDGSIGILPRRLMVHENDLQRALRTLSDNQIERR